MFILYDGAAMQTNGSRHRGIGRYTRQLLAGLRTVRPDWRIEVVEHGYSNPLPTADLNVSTRRFTPPLTRAWSTDTLNGRYYGDWLTALNPDWVILPSVFESEAIVPLFTGRRPPVAAICYDLIPLMFHQTYMTSPHFPYHWYAGRMQVIDATDQVLAISQSTADDTKRALGPTCPLVENIRGAAGPEFRMMSAGELGAIMPPLAARVGLHKPFILYVGGYDFRKNMVGAMAAYAALPASVRDRFDLCLTCRLDDFERGQLNAEAARLGVSDGVKLTGYVSDDEVRALYQACRVFFFPSLYEGLGLPVLEAMRCGAPVVVANTSSLPEFSGDVSWYCDPTSPPSMARALMRALDEPREARAAARAAFVGQFTWEGTAAAAAGALERNPAGNPTLTVPAAPRAKRLAVFSPIPPVPSGIAEYTIDVADQLADRYEIELVVDPTAPPVAPEVASRYRVLTADTLDARHAARPFDLFVYQMGNSLFHTYMLKHMARHRGLLVMHDVHVGGMLIAALRTGMWPTDMAGELERGGEGTLRECLGYGMAHPLLIEDYAPLSGRLLEMAAGVLVHSGTAWRRVKAMTPKPVSIVPQHIPHGPARDRAADRERLGIAADEFNVVTLGVVGRAKRIPAVVQAVAALPPAIRARTRVLVVGPAHPEDQRNLEKGIAALGLSDRVEFRGRVPLPDFAAYAAAADVCVQLRYPSRGETSAALLRAMAAGACCVTSDTGTMGEIPNTVTLKVNSPGRDVEQLTTILTRLAGDADLRERYADAARRYVAETCSGERVAEGYAAVIEDTIARLAATDQAWRDAALNAVHDSPVSDPEETLRAWAKVRRQAVQAVAPPRTARRAMGYRASA